MVCVYYIETPGELSDLQNVQRPGHIEFIISKTSGSGWVTSQKFRPNSIRDTNPSIPHSCQNTSLTVLAKTEVVMQHLVSRLPITQPKCIG